jgi:hypothetical protein
MYSFTICSGQGSMRYVASAPLRPGARLRPAPRCRNSATDHGHFQGDGHVVIASRLVGSFLAQDARGFVAAGGARQDHAWANPSGSPPVTHLIC